MGCYNCGCSINHHISGEQKGCTNGPCPCDKWQGDPKRYSARERELIAQTVKWPLDWVALSEAHWKKINETLAH